MKNIGEMIPSRKTIETPEEFKRFIEQINDLLNDQSRLKNDGDDDAKEKETKIWLAVKKLEEELERRLRAMDDSEKKIIAQELLNDLKKAAKEKDLERIREILRNTYDARLARKIEGGPDAKKSKGF